MKQTILFLRNGSLFANRTKAIEGLNSVTHKAGQPVIALYGPAGSVELIMAVGTENGKYKIVQEGLVSGTNIKTVNGTSILGSGDLSVGNVVAEDTTESIEDFTLESVSFWNTLNNEIERAQNAEQEAIIKAKDQTLRALYIAAGAKYNDTGKLIVKDTPWKNNIDSAEYKAQWNLDVLSGTVDTVTYGGKTYEFLVDTDGTWKIITRVGDKMIWNDTKVIHRPGYYYLNGLGDITEEQMKEIYSYGRTSVGYNGALSYNKSGRTHLPFNGMYNLSINNISYSIFSNKNIEVVNHTGGSSFGVGSYCFSSCANLRVISAWMLDGKINTDVFKACPKLQSVYLKNTNSKVSFADSPNINKISILGLIQRANPTTAITITLHADAYERLKDDTDIISALDEKNAALNAEGKGASINLISA